MSFTKFLPVESVNSGDIVFVEVFIQRYLFGKKPILQQNFAMAEILSYNEELEQAEICLVAAEKNCCYVLKSQLFIRRTR